jgi:hypothetical protein
MKKKRLDETLIDAMSYCSLRELPEVDNGTDLWIRALAKVAKSDGSFSYVYVIKDPDTLDNKVKKDFGTVSAIIKYLEYYPFYYLDARLMPTFDGNTKAERIEYLNKLDPSADHSKKTLKELNREVVRIVMKYQLEKEKRHQHLNITGDNE